MQLACLGGLHEVRAKKMSDLDNKISVNGGLEKLNSERDRVKCKPTIFVADWMKNVYGYLVIIIPRWNITMENFEPRPTD